MDTQNIETEFPPVALLTEEDSLALATAEVNEALLEIAQTLVKTEDDVEQETLATSLQKHRALILKFATMAYMKKPGSAMLLSSLITLVGAMEKSIRDDRKEKIKKEEGESNQISFNQIIESLNAISQGAVITPTFTLTNFLLDPTISLDSIMEGSAPIKEGELVQGNTLVDIEGNAI